MVDASFEYITILTYVNSDLVKINLTFSSIKEIFKFLKIDTN